MKLWLRWPSGPLSLLCLAPSVPLPLEFNALSLASVHTHTQHDGLFQLCRGPDSDPSCCLWGSPRPPLADEPLFLLKQEKANEERRQNAVSSKSKRAGEREPPGFVLGVLLAITWEGVGLAGARVPRGGCCPGCTVRPS